VLSLKDVTMMTFVAGLAASTARVASIPSRPVIDRSISTMSGSSSAAASEPSAILPTTSMPSAAPSRSLRPRRMKRVVVD
jgi:hypothetical protein